MKKLRLDICGTVGLLIVLGFISLQPLTISRHANGQTPGKLATDHDMDTELLKVLKIYFNRHKPDSIQAIIYNVSTKEFTAICTIQNSYQEACTQDMIFKPYLPGSVIKSLSMTVALDSGGIDDSFRTGYTGSVSVDSYRIYDYTMFNFDDVNLRQILSVSLNTGMVKIYQSMAKSLGSDVASEVVIDYLYERLLLGSSNMGVECYKCKMTTNVPSRNFRTAQAMFGIGIVSTPINLARAYSVFPGNGKLSWNDSTDTQVFEPDNIEFTKDIMVDSIKDSVSCGKDIVYGKSGTSPMIGRGGAYNDTYNYGTFVGGIESDEDHVLLVKIDNPKGNAVASGYAAEIWKNIYQELISTCRS